jgi:hypothetical protein
MSIIGIHVHIGILHIHVHVLIRTPMHAHTRACADAPLLAIPEIHIFW